MPGDETTELIHAKLTQYGLSEEEWRGMLDEIEECRKLA